MKRPFINRLNELDPKTWLKFQKSWFIHNPPRRSQNVLRHPAKFPETLAQEFIEFFTKSRQIVLDPMVGTGSTLVAALRAGRNSYGIELNPAYVALAKQIVEIEKQSVDSHPKDGLENSNVPTVQPSTPDTAEIYDGIGNSNAEPFIAEVIQGDAGQIGELIATHHIPLIDYVLTSPPYWDMLHAHGAKTQKKRRTSPALDVAYSDDPNDLGNITDYDEFLGRLVKIYERLQPFVRQGAYLTIIVKNIKKGGKIYPLAWDLGQHLGQTYRLKDEKIWVQNDIPLAPYGLGNSWVSNTFHHYCLQFKNE
jgi:DNA modification methylase